MRSFGPALLIASIAIVQGLLIVLLSGSRATESLAGAAFLACTLVPVAHAGWLAWWTVGRAGDNAMARAGVGVACVVAAAGWELVGAFFYGVAMVMRSDFAPFAVAFVVGPPILMLIFARKNLLEEYAR